MAQKKPTKGRKKDPAPIIDEQAIFEAFLNSHGFRMTRPRQAIFQVVFALHTHIDADKLTAYLEVKGLKVSRASVYRTLELLAQAGLVKRVRWGSGKCLYEHIHTGEHHDHLVCDICGKIIEFYSEEMETLQASICSAHSFEPRTHTMSIHGICAECQKKTSKKVK